MSVAQPNARLFGGGANRLRDPKLLEVAKLRISEGWLLQSVARELGYATRAAFTRAFAHVTGMRVGDWRLTDEGKAMIAKHRERVRSEVKLLRDRTHPSGRCEEARLYW